MSKTKIKSISIIIVLTILLNVFMPVTALNKKVYAVTLTPSAPSVLVNRVSDIQTEGSVRYFTIEIAIIGDVTCPGYDIQLAYDKTKVMPGLTSSQAATVSTCATTLNGWSLSTGAFAANDGLIRLANSTTTPKNAVTFTQTATADAAELGKTYNTYGYSGYMPTCSINMKILDENIQTASDITTDLLDLEPYEGVTTGFQFEYVADSEDNLVREFSTDASYLAYKGFTTPVVRTITGIDITTNPTTTTYNHGENVSLAGGKLTLSYSDSTSEIIDLTAEGVSITGGSPAAVGTDTVTISYGDFTDTFNITVNDPINSIALTTMPTTLNYYEGNSVNLTGAVLTATSLSGAQTVINLPDYRVSSDASLISLKSPNIVGEVSTNASGVPTATQKVTLTYDGKTTSFNINVTDSIYSIAVNNAKTQYKYNEDLDLSVGTVLATFKSTLQRSIDLSDTSTVTITGYDKTTVGGQEVTVSAFGKTTKYNVNVADYVTGINVTEPTKTAYKLGQELDLTGATATTVKASGATGDSINISDLVITGYNKNLAILQTVTATYTTTNTIDGTSRSFTDTFDVTVEDYITGIELVAPTKLEYRYGEELNLTGASAVAVMASGASGTNIEVTSSMISGYVATTLGEQTVTVTYTTTNTIDGTSKNFTDTFNVNVSDYVTDVTITPPTKIAYNHGETLDLTGGSIVEQYASGASETVTMTTAMITESDNSAVVMNPSSYNTTNKLSKTLKITYGGETSDYAITIINDVKSIAMKTMPKTEYNVNDTLDLTNGQITITRAVGTSTMLIIPAMTSGFSTSAEVTNKPITVTYTENGISKTTSYNINVVDSIIGFTITTNPTKTEYKYGEALSVADGKLTVVRGSGPAIIDMASTMVTGYNATTLGTQTLTVNYGGFSQTYNVTVLDYATDILVENFPIGTHEYGEDLDLTNTTVKLIMASGASVNPVPVTSAMITGYSKTTKGTQTVTVTYQTFTKEFGVTIEDNVKSITKNSDPTKTIYKYGEQIDLTGAKINVIRTSGATEEVVATNSMISGYNPNKLGAQEITVTYSGKTTSFNVTVQDYISGIEITKPTKTSYKLNETLDVTGGKVTTIMASTATGTTVDMTVSMVSELNSDTEGRKVLTVTYEGFTKTFSVDVTDAVIGISIMEPTKTTYKYGEELDLTGGKVTIAKESGAIVGPINMTLEMITGYNKNQLNEQLVTVTYEGKTKTFDVTVVDWDKEIRITSMPKTQYEYGEELDVEDGKVAIYQASGAIKGEAVDMTAGMVTGYNSTKEGTQTLTIEWSGFTTTYDINLIDTIKDISINTAPNKTEYAYGESLDLTGATLKVIKISGEYIIKLTDLMISGYDANKSGEQSITVTYGGKTINFLGTVGEKPVTKTVVTPTKTNTTPITPVTPSDIVPANTTPVVEPKDSKKIDKVNNKNETKEESTISDAKDEKQDTQNITTLIIIISASILIIIVIIIIVKKNKKQ